MTQMTNTVFSWQSILWRSSASWVYKTFLVFFASLIIAASAQIEVPMFPVPVTLQTFAILLTAMTLGWRLGGLAIVAYIAEGAAGLPVFAGFGAGFMHLVGPTGGYLWAFLLAALLAGFLAEKGLVKNFASTILVGALSIAVILLIGMAYLIKFVGWPQAYVLGVQPFLLGAALKTIMLAVIVPKFWRKVSK
jgi:biotin transport system substrate-specific component